MSNGIADLFRHLTAGVYVIGVADGDRRNAFTASSIMQISFSPLLLAISISPAHESYALLGGGRVFSINVLGEQQQALARHFGTQSGRTVDKLASIPWRPGKSGAPLLRDALAHFDCRVVSDIEAGDHRLVVGRVIDGTVVSPHGRPLIYAQTGNMDMSASLFPPDFS
ncbi:flavin reductase like domain protein [Paraburkholderia xenovorans LB400]|uniref:Flavin reductase-like protein n=1 Tax=Paraburkholderia xenovorans (strain LB400) TaxID=266265 RepID=Q13IK2_PARXL|nr:flavin reductase family protein [Paraburkholderia xenovorans]ABE36087.1 flavin reductase-like protein [Paraburkholderia xenovorans LB400]AIP34779.1 flavin reductase like domain protein [Paraburkholderia xenovorans LB400]